jgi:Antitoxin VbhA
MLSAAQITQNLRAVDHAVAQQRLEGLTVPPEQIADMRRVARGDMTDDELIRKLYSRFPNVPIFRPR